MSKLAQTRLELKCIPNPGSRKWRQVGSVNVTTKRLLITFMSESDADCFSIGASFWPDEGLLSFSSPK